MPWCLVRLVKLELSLIVLYRFIFGTLISLFIGFSENGFA